MSVSFARRVQASSLVVDGNPEGRDGFSDSKSWTVGRATGGRREKTQREELQCQMKDDTAERLVVKTMTNNIFTSLGQCDDRLTARVCTFRVVDRSKSETMISSSRDHERLEVLLDSACVMAENRESWMCRFSKSRRVIARDKECETAQRCVNVDKLVNEMITSYVQVLMVVESDQEVKFDQETSITDVKNTLTSELRSVGRSSDVSKESPMSASAVNALIEKSVREMQSTVRTIVAYIEWVCGAMLNSGCASSTWTAEIEGHVVNRSRSSVTDAQTACKRRKRKSCRKALVKFDELVMLMIEKPRHQPYANTIMLDLVDRSDEVVVGMTNRVVKARVVYRVPKEQRDGARDTRSVRGVPWQQTSAETLGGELRARVSDLWRSTLRWDV